MTEYNWTKLVHDLATHEDVMGWKESKATCGCTYLAREDKGLCYAIRGLHEAHENCDFLLGCHLWKPHEDLNQA